MLKRACLILVLLVVSATVVSAEPVEVERILPESVNAGETVQVTLNMKFTGETPSGIIVTEFLPAGWKIKSSVPSFTEFQDKVSWLLYGDKVKNSSIKYEVEVPENFSEPQLMQGSWETINSSGIISGDQMLIPATEKKVLIEDDIKEPDYTMLIAAGIIIIVLIAAAFVLTKKKK